MADTTRETLERVQKVATAVVADVAMGGEGKLLIGAIEILMDAITEALAGLEVLERDREVLKGLLRKALGWEGRLNAADQSLMQGHKRDALNQRDSVARERIEVTRILGKKGTL